MERLKGIQSGAVSKSFSWVGLCFVLALTALATGAIVWHWDSIVARQGTLLAHLRAGGVVGPLWCVLAQALQVVIFIIPGERKSPPVMFFWRPYSEACWPGGCAFL
jgi:hypothetical protein